MLVVDLLTNRGKSMVASALKYFYNVVKNSAKIGARIVKALVSVVSDASTRAALKLAFNKFSILEKGVLGLRWLKTTYNLGADAAAALLREMAEKGAYSVGARALAQGAARAGATAGRAALSAGKLALGVAADPLMVATIAGMALDIEDAGGCLAAIQTSDYLQVKRAEDAKTQSSQIDCGSWPLGPTCPPSPAAAAPGPAPPDPPPRNGRYPNFMGPLDLVDMDSMFDSILNKIHDLFTDPVISNGPLAQVVTDLKTLPSTTAISEVIRRLDEFQKSLDWLAPGATIDFNSSLTYWSNTASQSLIVACTNRLVDQPGASRSVAQLKVIGGIQRTMGDYLNILVTTGTDPGSVWITSQLALSNGNLPDSIIEELIQEETDMFCIKNGGVIINPGSGYSAHTCTWARKADCHGAFPWTENEITPTTEKLLCAGSAPAPCPVPSPTPGCIPNGSYSPANGSDCCSQADIDADGKCRPVHCPPPVPIQLSPCPATTDPNGADLTYTEWRNKDWFSAAGTPWASIIDSSQIPSGGACIQANPSLHIYCDEEHTTARARTGVKNSYDRVHGMCINTPEYCDAKGLSYGDVPLTDMGVGNDMAPLVGGTRLKSCYEELSQEIIADIGFGETIARDCIPGFGGGLETFFGGGFFPDVTGALHTIDTIIAGYAEGSQLAVQAFNYIFTPEGMNRFITEPPFTTPPRRYADCPPGRIPSFDDRGRKWCTEPPPVYGIGATEEGNCLQVGTGNSGTATATTYGSQWFAGACISNSQCPPCPLGKKAAAPLRRSHCDCVPARTGAITETNQFGIPLCVGSTGMSLDGFSCQPLTAGTLGQTNTACPYYVADSSGKYNFCRPACPPGSIAGTGLTYGMCFDPSGNSIFKGPPANQFPYFTI
jgi:hypothetical protein